MTSPSVKRVNDMFGHREKFKITHPVSRCSNKKCKSDRRKNIDVFDCEILNEMIGRDVCKPFYDLCLDCIKLYYKKSYEEIVEIDNKRQVQKN